ncbi:MAG: hypothetical protein WA657_23145 [Candidatus Acidiferrales bacterium]
MKDMSAIRKLQSLLKTRKFSQADVRAINHAIRRIARSKAVDYSIWLQWHGDRNENNPICSCPVCGNRGPLMNNFSLLQAGFNGVKDDTPDDLDAQECGRCGAILNWN